MNTVKLTFKIFAILSLLLNLLYGQKLDKNLTYFTKMLNGEIKYYDQKTDKLAVCFKDISARDEFEQVVSQNQINLTDGIKYGLIVTYNNLNRIALEDIKSFLSEFRSVKWIYPTYQRRDTGTEFILTDEIIIHFDESTSDQLKEKYLQKFNLSFKRELCTGSIVAIVQTPLRRLSLNIIDSLSYSEDIKWVYPNWLQVGVFSDTEPNDPLYNISDQWALFKVNAGAAWDFRPSHANHEIKIGILDTGADMDHSDLDSNIINSWFFYDPPFIENINDEDGHGTRMAGVAAARCHNNNDITGMGWNPGLVIVKWAPGDAGSSEALIDAINWAAGWDGDDYRTDVINMSFRHESDQDDIKAVIDDAIENNIVVVAASGNKNDDRVDWPAGYAPVIAVGSTDYQDQRWEYYSNGSNYGNNLDLVAPGTDNQYGNNYTTDLEDGVIREGGTSYSAALVSGISSLILAVNPGLTPNQVTDALTETAVKLEEYTFINGWNEEVGYGMVDAYNAVRYFPPRPTNLSVNSDDGCAEIGWQDNSNNEDGFKICRRVNGGTWNNDYATRTATYYFDYGISHGNTYEYRVYAYIDGRNSSYSNTDVTPYDGWITGPGSLGFKEFGTWPANAVAGSGSYTYQWYKRMHGSQIWTMRGTSRTQNERMISTGFDLKVEIDDGSQIAEDIHSVYYGIPPKILPEESQELSLLPEEYILFQNFPNPFNNATQIKFNLINDCHVSLYVYNIHGQKILTLVDRMVQKGFHRIQFVASGLASGIYFYKISAGEFSDLKKMILTK